MKEEEKGILIKNKLAEKKSYSQINKELETFKKSQKIFKETKNQIKLLELAVDKITKERDKLKKDLFNLNLKQKSKPVKEIETNNATLKDLSRITMILSASDKPLSVSQIRQIGLGLTHAKINPCLAFLEKHNLVYQSNNKGYLIKCIELKN